jgi:hypothetical protein
MVHCCLSAVTMQAAGAVMALVDRVVAGSQAGAAPPPAFAICRPPGHHAVPCSAMGFCILSNVAIAARYAQQHHGLKKVGRAPPPPCIFRVPVSAAASAVRIQRRTLEPACALPSNGRRYLYSILTFTTVRRRTPRGCCAASCCVNAQPSRMHSCTSGAQAGRGAHPFALPRR